MRKEKRLMQQKAPASLGGVVHEEGYTSLCLFSTWHNGVMVSQMSANHSVLSDIQVRILVMPFADQ